jgi:hypothetical protein
MRVTVEISDADMREICLVTGESNEGPAIRRLLNDALLLKRRELIAAKFMSGEWGVELEGFEAGQDFDRKAEERDEQRWRGD